MNFINCMMNFNIIKSYSLSVEVNIQVIVNIVNIEWKILMLSIENNIEHIVNKRLILLACQC